MSVNTSTKEEVWSHITDLDRETITNFLKSQQTDENPNPLLPLDVDIDGDGIVDALGLDALGKLTIASGVPLDYTVYESTGE